MEHPDEILFPGLVGEIAPRENSRDHGGRENSRDHGGRENIDQWPEIRRYPVAKVPITDTKAVANHFRAILGDYIQDLSIEDVLSVSRREVPSWYCSLEDANYVLDERRNRISELSLLRDNDGERIVVKPTNHAMEAILRFWRQPRIQSLATLCLRVLQKIPPDELSEMCDQFMGVKALREVLSMNIPHASTIQRILRSRYDRFLISHHHIAQTAPNWHFSLYVPTTRVKIEKSSGVLGIAYSINVPEKHFDANVPLMPECSFVAWMRYHRMRSEICMLCPPCKIMAEEEMYRLKEMGYMLSVGARLSCPCEVHGCKCPEKVNKSIWNSNRYRREALEAQKLELKRIRGTDVHGSAYFSAREWWGTNISPSDLRPLEPERNLTVTGGMSGVSMHVPHPVTRAKRTSPRPVPTISYTRNILGEQIRNNPRQQRHVKAPRKGHKKNHR